LIASTFLVPAYRGCPGKEATEWVSVSFVQRCTLAASLLSDTILILCATKCRQVV